MQEPTGTERPQEKAQIEIYTAICGGKDPIRKDIRCFTKPHGFTRPVMDAKKYKILSHAYVDADISIWVDGNITLLQDKEEFVKWFLGDADIGVWKHFERDCVYDEAPAAKGLGAEYALNIDEQIEHYRKIGFPRNAGLAECNVIVRRHTPEMIKFNSEWWNEIYRWSCRDQLSFPVVLGRFPNLKVKYNEGNVRYHKHFKYEPHPLQRR